MSFNTHQTFLMNHFMQFGSEKELDVAAEIAEILFALGYGKGGPGCGLV